VSAHAIGARGQESLVELHRQLSPARKARLAAEIAYVYATVRRLTREHTLTEVLAALRALPVKERISEDERRTWLRSARLGWAVGRTLRTLPADSRCLRQSLVLTGLLARRGIPSTLIIGVKPGEAFGAHAWVEYQGHALLPGSQNIYERLAEL
jgi:hypothetical protein